MPGAPEGSVDVGLWGVAAFAVGPIGAWGAAKARAPTPPKVRASQSALRPATFAHGPPRIHAHTQRKPQALLGPLRQAKRIEGGSAGGGLTVEKVLTVTDLSPFT